MKTWYAVYTKKNCEKKVIHKLKRNKIKLFSPFIRILSNNEREPLFPSYVFVNTSENELRNILNFQGIINPIYWLNKTVCFAEKEIEKLKDFIKTHSIIEVKKIDLNFNEIQNETFEGQKVGNLKLVPLSPDMLAIPMLGVLLTSERNLAPEFRFNKNQSFNKFLYRLGLTNLF